MPAPATIAEFLAVVQKSGVLDTSRLEASLQQLPADPAPPSPGQLAEVLVRDGLLTRFQVQQLLLGKYLGFTIGKYKVLELLGSGGMSAVYLCEHMEHHYRVALKVIPKSQARNPTLLKRFYREARASAALNHPNIVRGYEAGQERNQHFFVMEYVDGPSLWDIVKKFGPMPILRASHFMRQAAQGLQYAHEAGLVHRDIKPGNLLIDRQGTIKILDMGLSRFDNADDSVLTEDVLGTVEYLAPEQARDSHLVDIRADIFSLGGTFYFLLTGGPPFSKARLSPDILGQRMRGPRPIRLLRPEVPEELAGVINRMMAEKPDERYTTPADVATALVPWTREPIPLPSEAEMPQLSPAARAAGAAPPPEPRSDPAKKSWLGRLLGNFRER